MKTPLISSAVFVGHASRLPLRFFQVSSEMTAGRVCAEVVAIKKLPPNIDWVLFEVIDNGAMGEYCTIQGKKKHLGCSQKLNDLLVRNDVHSVDPLLSDTSIPGTLARSLWDFLNRSSNVLWHRVIAGCVLHHTFTDESDKTATS